jgi:hypothetical protein
MIPPAPKIWKVKNSAVKNLDNKIYGLLILLVNPTITKSGAKVQNM